MSPEKRVRVISHMPRALMFGSITAPPFRFIDAQGSDAWDSGRSVSYAVGTDTLLAHGTRAVKAFPLARARTPTSREAGLAQPVVECTSPQVACAAQAHQL